VKNNKTKVIIDIGACIGEFIDYCLKQYIDIIVYAIEPFKPNYSHLLSKYQSNDNVKVYELAIANFEGVAKLYKKKNSEGKYDFVGNNGCSLVKKKSNVSFFNNEKVIVNQLSKFIKDQGLKEIEIVKLDVEGVEYEILNDIMENNLFENIDKIYFEDHSRKVKGLYRKRKQFLKKIKSLGIEEKIFLQDISNASHKYVPLRIAEKNSFWD